MAGIRHFRFETLQQLFHHFVPPYGILFISRDYRLFARATILLLQHQNLGIGVGKERHRGRIRLIHGREHGKVDYPSHSSEAA